MIDGGDLRGVSRPNEMPQPLPDLLPPFFKSDPDAVFADRLLIAFPSGRIGTAEVAHGAIRELKMPQPLPHLLPPLFKSDPGAVFADRLLIAFPAGRIGIAEVAHGAIRERTHGDTVRWCCPAD